MILPPPEESEVMKRRSKGPRALSGLSCSTRVWINYKGHSSQSFSLFIYFAVAEDIQMMLFLGFGFLMTFLRRFGYSALVQTMGVITVSVEMTVVVQGTVFRGLDEDGYLPVSMGQ